MAKAAMIEMAILPMAMPSAMTMLLISISAAPACAPTRWP